MTLYFIGIGLNDEKDITVKGLEAVKKCDLIYLESYTSKLQVPVEKLEKLYEKEIIIADRKLVEQEAEKTILKNAKTKGVAFLVIGDPMCATTHVDLMLRAKQAKIETQVIHNASIINAIGEIGLEIYKYGKITSIPFDNENVKAPYNVFINNLDKGMHTLFLLDLDPIKNKYLTIKQAAEYLINQGVTKETKAIACARIGNDNPKIIYTEINKLKDKDFGKPPYCLIIPAEMHFMEEEALKQWQL
jgi:diphthine synthase